jgi:branched-chain amino acid transport system permease protein
MEKIRDIRGLGRPGKRGILIVLGAFVFAAALPAAVRNDYLIHIASFVLYYMIAAVSLDIVAGFLGEISFGHAGFLAVGAYTTAILNMRVLPDAWPSFWIALLAGGLVSAAAGVVVGIPALRISGQYFFMVTMGFGEIIRFVLLNWQGVTTGPWASPPFRPPGSGSFGSWRGPTTTISFSSF